MIQTKIVESESARAAAELRNATLQREMEQFFDTFGELNNEAKKTECIVKSFWRRVCVWCDDMNGVYIVQGEKKAPDLVHSLDSY